MGWVPASHGQAKPVGEGPEARRPAEPRLSGDQTHRAQNFIRSALRFPAAQFIAFIVGKSSHTITATHVGF